MLSFCIFISYDGWPTMLTQSFSHYWRKLACVAGVIRERETENSGARGGGKGNTLTMPAYLFLYLKIPNVYYPFPSEIFCGFVCLQCKRLNRGEGPDFFYL